MLLLFSRCKLIFVDSKNCGVIECVEDVRSGGRDTNDLLRTRECKHRLIRFFDLFLNLVKFFYLKEILKLI